jgi:peptide/nickel transport system substrate-binding protein
MKSIIKRAALICAVLLTLSANLSASGGGDNGASPKPAPVKEKVVVYGLSSSWDRLMPYDLSAMNTVLPNAMIFDRLTYVSENLGMRNAKSIEEQDGGKTFVITLNEKAKFHDGKPVTSDDWHWTFTTFSDPAFKGRSKSYFGFFAGTDNTGSRVPGEKFGVEAPAPYTLILRLKDANHPEGFFSANGWYLAVTPKHLLKDIPVDKLLDHEFWNNPVGSGPFKFVSQQPGSELVLAANDDYYLGRVQFDRLIYRVVAPAAAPNALLAGEIDTCFAALAPDVAMSLNGQNGLHADKSIATLNMVMTLNNELFPPKVRKAFSLAIDKEFLLKTWCNGLGQITESYLMPSSKYNNNALPKGRDLRKAKQLLDEAGFDYNRTYTLGTSKAREKLAVVIQQNLADAGVKIEISLGEGTAAMIRARDAEIDALMLSFTTSPSPLYMMAHMNPALPNYSRLVDPKIYEYQVAMANEQDTSKRIQIAKESQVYYAEICPYVALFQQDIYMVASAKLNNIEVGNYDAPWTWKVD